MKETKSGNLVFCCGENRLSVLAFSPPITKQYEYGLMAVHTLSISTMVIKLITGKEIQSPAVLGMEFV